MPDSAFAIAFVTLTFLLAGMVKGVIGMGLPTLAMGLLALVMAPVQAAALLVIPSLVTNVWQLAAGPAFNSVARRFAVMMLCVVLGTFAGIGLLTGSAGPAASAVLGAVLAVYGVVGLASPRLVFPSRAEKWLSPPVGLITGLLTGATGVFVIPAVPYFNSLGLEKEELIQTLGLSFTVSTVALAAALMASGRLPAAVAAGSLLALLPALAGMILGQYVRDRLRPEAFRRWFFVGLLAIGVYMAARAAGKL